MASNLFDKAKRATPAKKLPKADSKKRVSIDDVDFFEKIQNLEVISDRMKSDKIKYDLIADEVRNTAKTEWVKLYQETGENPGSIMVESKIEPDMAQVMLVPSDRYITINAEKAEILREEFGDAIVEESTTFSFDKEMIEKYGEVLSKMIEESNEISESDKDKIIKAATTYEIAKGTIDIMAEYGDIDMVMESIRPVVSLKGPEIIKG